MNPVLLDPGYRQDCLPCTIWMMIFLWNILWVIRLGILCWRRRKCQRGWWVDYIWLVWRGFANSLWIVWNWIMFLCGFWWSPHFIVILAIVIHSVTSDGLFVVLLKGIFENISYICSKCCEIHFFYNVLSIILQEWSADFAKFTL